MAEAASAPVPNAEPEAVVAEEAEEALTPPVEKKGVFCMAGALCIVHMVGCSKVSIVMSFVTYFLLFHHHFYAWK